MEEFNNKKMTAAVQEAERLVRELETTTLEVKDLDEEAEYFMKKYEMEAEARGRLERYIEKYFGRAEKLASWQTYRYRAQIPLPRASPPPYPLPSSARRAAPSAASAKTAVASAASASLGEALVPSSPSPLLPPSFIEALCLSRLPQEEAQAWGGQQSAKSPPPLDRERSPPSNTDASGWLGSSPHHRSDPWRSEHLPPPPSSPDCRSPNHSCPLFSLASPFNRISPFHSPDRGPVNHAW